MDAQINLKLRRSDRSTILLRKHEDEKSIKRDHIRDMLIQNFNRRFGRPGEHKPTNQGYYESDKVILEEATKFLKLHPRSINSKDLARFEQELASKLQWQRLRNEGNRSLVRISMPSYKHQTPIV